MTVKERLGALRARMKKEGYDAFLIVTDDFHGSEYVGDYFKTRAYFSGFTGSAGTLVVFPETAALFTDGRYFLQAGEELSGSGITLMKMGEPEVPTVTEYLSDGLKAGQRLAFDGRTVTAALYGELKEALSKKAIRFVDTTDPADGIWTDRPELSHRPVFELPAAMTGRTREEKLFSLRAQMTGEGATHLLLTALDEVAYTLNLRGDDVACTPVFLSFLLLEPQGARLFAASDAFSPEIRAALSSAEVTIEPYEEIYAALSALPRDSRVWLDVQSANERVLCALSGTDILEKTSPVVMMKAVKTAAECENIRKAHEKDGLALTRFLYYLKTHVGKEPLSELGAAEKLEEYRRMGEGYLGPSFDPIVAFGAHAAIVHYEPTEKTDIPLRPEGLCLIDTGGQYREGTTDVTRTVVLGALTDREKEFYTRVLIGHLRLAAARFPEGVSGANLDALARMPLWEIGADYRHGTGHGVGYLLSVHEGPQSLRWRISGKFRPVALSAGMVVSDEPGYYEEGAFGIRHENLLLVGEEETTPYGHFFGFEALTLVPFDKEGILPECFGAGDRALLNAYHKKVWEALSPHLSGAELDYLREATAPM